MTNSTSVPYPRILRLKQLSERIGLGRSTIYDRMDAQSPRYDATFPKPIKLGASAIGWIDSEITTWIEQRMSANEAR
ncbi:helix-turn-helix transcriptional regulator [Pseudomonas costantinii]|uniref:AlpA family transcriptional regulator n=1 Tax=Pseudomonas costantinii TaxID=168469 RepID=A0A1S2UVP6_9PSED|nr:AlpA family phage regulatory protein [Pseudomonas costantinii]OIN50494.1 AlpA family transcriptional regulator [Pseudomonas costantinii]